MFVIEGVGCGVFVCESSGVDMTGAVGVISATGVDETNKLQAIKNRKNSAKQEKRYFIFILLSFIVRFYLSKIKKHQSTDVVDWCECRGGDLDSRPRAYESPALPLSYLGRVRAGQILLWESPFVNVRLLIGWA